MNMFSAGLVLQLFPSDASANIILSHKHTSASTWFHLLSCLPYSLYALHHPHYIYLAEKLQMPFPNATPYTQPPFALSPLPPALLCHSLEFTSKPEAEIYSPASLSFFMEAISFCLVPSITGLGQTAVHISL